MRCSSGSPADVGEPRLQLGFADNAVATIFGNHGVWASPVHDLIDFLPLLSVITAKAALSHRFMNAWWNSQNPWPSARHESTTRWRSLAVVFMRYSSPTRHDDFCGTSRLPNSAQQHVTRCNVRSWLARPSYRPAPHDQVHIRGLERDG